MGVRRVFVLSVVLVIVGAVTLALGIFNVGGENSLTFVYISIASCLAAAVFLGIGVLRGRPKRKPVVTGTQGAAEASWSGASAWPRTGTAAEGDGGESAGPESARPESSLGVLEGPTGRDAEPEEEEADVVYQPLNRRVTVQEADLSAVDEDEEEEEETAVGAEAAVPQDAPAAAVVATEAAAEDAEAVRELDDEDIVVVPKRSTAKRVPTRKAATRKAATRKATAKKATAKKATVKKATVKKATVKKATAEKATVKKATAEKATVKKATAKRATAQRAAAPATAEPAVATRATAQKATAQKATAQKATAKRAATGADETARIRAAIGNVPGVGPGKVTQLGASFGTLRKLQGASVEELRKVPGISDTLARRIHDALRG
jgi:hypothetical protein